MTFKRRFNADHNYFDIIDTKERAYWLGFFATDGSIGEKNKLILRLASIDIGHIEKFKFALRSEHNIVTACYNNKGFYNSCIIIRSTQMTQSLARLGIVPQKTFTVHRPRLHPSLLRHYWRGAFDGDGSIYQLSSNGPYNISFCGNPLMVQDYIADIKIYLNIDVKYETKDNIQSAYTRKRADVLSILNWLYQDSTIYLDRKYKQYQDFKSNYVAVKPDATELFTPDLFYKEYNNLGSLIAIANKYNFHQSTIQRLNKRFKKLGYGPQQ